VEAHRLEPLAAELLPELLEAAVLLAVVLTSVARSKRLP
jgi:hypothetical protein